MGAEAQREQGTRAQQEQARRRRRGGDSLVADKKLPIPPEVQARLDAEGLVPRWVNDEGNRMYRLLEQDDYEKVAGVDPVPAGRAKDGSPILAHLLAKPRSYIEQDRAEAEARRKAVETSLFRSADAADAASRGPNPDKPVSERFVTPDSKLNRGNQILE